MLRRKRKVTAEQVEALTAEVRRLSALTDEVRAVTSQEALAAAADALSGQIGSQVRRRTAAGSLARV